MDKVLIRGLRVDAVIGVYDWERSIQQTLLIDVELTTDISAAAAADDLTFALDYKSVCDQISSLVQERKAQLIETLAEEIAQYLLKNFATSWVRVTVNKPEAIPAAQSVGVQIERGKNLSNG